MIVVDASVMIAWLINEPHLSLNDDIYRLLGTESIVVPAHWPAEIGNALLVNARRGRIPLARLDDMIQQIHMLDITVETPSLIESVDAVIQFATKEKLTAYDAAYVILARKANATLLTVDKEMRDAARRTEIPVLPG